MKAKSILATILLIIVSTFLGCTSHIGVIEFNPFGDEWMYETLGQNVAIAILDFPDRRHDSKGKESMIGTVYGGYKNPLKRIYSEQTINLEVMEAMENLFRENGFRVKKYPGVSDYSSLLDERLAVKGQINKFWTESYNRIGAVVDIDLEIFDRKHEKILWNGKINDFQKKGGGGGVFTNPNMMVLFLNQVLSSAIKKAWTQQGMLKALESLPKE